MRNVVLYIAMSLDGYIADANGGVDWLGGQGDGETEDTYSEFIRRVDTVVMGWNTYRQISQELSPDVWVYEGLQSYVVTHRTPTQRKGITFTADDPVKLVRRLREGEGKDVWICGGASLVRQLMEADLIDEFYLSVIPTVLGGGIRLFGDLPRPLPLRLVRTRTYDGIAELVYVRREGGESLKS